MKKVLFIDRDGTLITEPADEQIDSFAKLEFYPQCLYYLSKIARELDFELVMVPGENHGDGGAYGIRRREDFFIKHLLHRDSPDRNVAPSTPPASR